MLEKEKIIKGLETIIHDDKMWRKADYYATICKEALELIKSQQAEITELAGRYSDLLGENMELQVRELEGWDVEKRKDDSVVRTDLVCACGAVVWQDEILFKNRHTANRLFCPACGLSMRSPEHDRGGKYLKNAWRTIVMQQASRAKEMVRINLNDFVRFKLTARGREIFEHHLDDALKYLPDVDRSKLEEATDFNGYKKMQLHRFMNIFGPYLMNGAPVPVENVEIIYDIPETTRPA